MSRKQSFRPGRLTLLLVAAVLVCLAGCSGKKPKSKVTGKVTVGDKPVMGEVVFLGDDGKEFKGVINAKDGIYTLLDAPNGQYKVAVKGMGAGLNVPGGGGQVAPPKDAPKMDMPDLARGQSVQPPAKYGDPKTSGLTFEVTGGEQTFDIPLKP